MGGDDIRAVIPVPTRGSGGAGPDCAPSFRLWAWQQRTWVMGVLNLTPDSFSDGGQHFEAADAIRQVRWEAASTQHLCTCTR